MRIGVIGLWHESNTFVSRPTTIDDFRADTLLEGDDVGQLADTHHEVGGFLQYLAGTSQVARVTAVPVFMARALPAGIITADALQQLLARMFARLESAGQLDGVLVAPHGAAVSESARDADGFWLAKLRERVGPNVPIVGTLDAHANLSPGMLSSCDALVAYRTNPHVDQRERGIEAARILVRMLRGEIRPTMAAALPPLAINIERQLTDEPPCRPLYDIADRQLEDARVLSNSILLGFPYADVADMGSAAIVIADDDQPHAQRLVNELARGIWSHRQQWIGQLMGVEEALATCAALEGPICLLDMGDNVGGGSAADGTLLARALLGRNVGPALVCICDPESVQQACAAGIGSHVALRVGGKTDGQHGPPLEAIYEVRSIHEGRFTEPEVRHGGIAHFDQGQTVIVTASEALTILLTSRRMPPFSLRQLTSCGLDPASYRILVAKGVHAPVAAYRDVCRHFIRVDTPGSTRADMTRLDFEHRRRPMYPFELDVEWSAE